MTSDNLFAELSENTTATAVFKPCGCCVAVDLAFDPQVRLTWRSNGYVLRNMKKPEAIALLNSSLCMHSGE